MQTKVSSGTSLRLLLSFFFQLLCDRLALNVSFSFTHVNPKRNFKTVLSLQQLVTVVF